MHSRSSPLLVNFGPGVSPPRSKIEKSIARSTVVSPVRQTCSTVADRVCCEKHSDAWSVTADFVFRGDRRSAIGMWGVRTTGVLVVNWHYCCKQIKKSIFRLGRGDGKEDLICPIDPSRENRQRTHVNGAVVCTYEDSPQEMEEVRLFTVNCPVWAPGL